MTEAPVCPVSGQVMFRDTRPFTLHYKGSVRTFDMPGWYCDGSGESIFTRADMKISDRELATLKATVENLATPAEVARLRKTLGLSQAKAGEIFGGGLRAFQKYESGETSTSRVMTNLLRVVSRHPEEVEQMAAEASKREAKMPWKMP
ncbi:MAG: type II toxin-antitoxin system MqsA family antitoxin [Methylobacterium sp.]|uniref:type II toxin-antitoxin system MqsA family antitoxin n=1 Tax=unclassified Methylobacterium TaxID=2615210 RepID=UPI0011C91F81|nr:MULTISPECIES: type II toxin-antitoxin system MqsA family antitoxin [unclassified Methylobacterium]MDO9429097.1 type II toxin-antitoxin system MqsA family antitoxin [Methylobacterium sp.]TXM69560.1 type II toxin-antitoxin system MqsA family antitoxin [Methylobacterium sp. WL69]